VAHWLPATHKRVERGAATENDFRDLVYGKPYKFYPEANPYFFK